MANKLSPKKVIMNALTKEFKKLPSMSDAVFNSYEFKVTRRDNRLRISWVLDINSCATFEFVKKIVNAIPKSELYDLELTLAYNCTSARKDKIVQDILKMEEYKNLEWHCKRFIDRDFKTNEAAMDLYFENLKNQIDF